MAGALQPNLWVEVAVHGVAAEEPAEEHDFLCKEKPHAHRRRLGLLGEILKVVLQVPIGAGTFTVVLVLGCLRH